MHPSNPTTTAPDQPIWLERTCPQTLHLSGEIDLGAISRFCDHVAARDVAGLGRVLAEHGVRRVDLRAVTFADSTLLDLLSGLDAATGADRLDVRDLPPAVELLLDLTGTRQLVERHVTRTRPAGAVFTS